nr:MAG: mandelate racemase [Thermoproteus sp. AZ2]
MSAISSVEGFIIGRAGAQEKWASLMVVVRVTTKDGQVGYGETVSSNRAKAVVEIIKRIGVALKGRDALNIQANWRLWYLHDFNLSVSLESAGALSAVEMALWDIAGRHFGAPVYRLLGGALRDRVRVYANGWYGGCVEAQCFAERAKAVASMGYTALKFDPFGKYFDQIDERGLREAEERVKAVREAVGDDVDILIEHHGRFDANAAIAIAKRLEPYNPYFMEEPVHPENVEGLRRYRQLVRLRVALGERIIRRDWALVYLREGLLDELQLDVGRIGGILEAFRTAAVAESFGVMASPHNANGPLLHAATLQLDSVLPNFDLQESFYDFWPQWKRDLVIGLPPIEGGYAKVPNRPGLGVEVNERLLEELVYAGEEPFDPNEPSWVVRGTWGSP